MYMMKGLQSRVEGLRGEVYIYVLCSAYICSSPAFSGLPESHKAQRENIDRYIEHVQSSSPRKAFLF
jgi:hypothetical protein